MVVAVRRNPDDIVPRDPDLGFPNAPSLACYWHLPSQCGHSFTASCCAHAKSYAPALKLSGPWKVLGTGPHTHIEDQQRQCPFFHCNCYALLSLTVLLYCCVCSDATCFHMFCRLHNQLRAVSFDRFALPLCSDERHPTIFCGHPSIYNPRFHLLPFCLCTTNRNPNYCAVSGPVTLPGSSPAHPAAQRVPEPC